MKTKTRYTQALLGVIGLAVLTILLEDFFGLPFDVSFCASLAMVLALFEYRGIKKRRELIQSAELRVQEARTLMLQIRRECPDPRVIEAADNNLRESERLSNSLAHLRKSVF